MNRFIKTQLVVIVLVLIACSAAYAGDREEALNSSSDLYNPSPLGGDWGGDRTRLKESGFTFKPRLTQFYQGMVTGDGDQSFKYGGKFDVMCTGDLEKLGLWKGLSLKVHGEYNFGHSANGVGGTGLITGRSRDTWGAGYYYYSVSDVLKNSLKRDHKHDLAFRPLETSLEKGVIDAMYTQTGPFQHLQEATGKFKAIEDLSRYPDWTLQVANIPAAITCSDVMAEKHPELAVTFMKGMIKVGRWANEHKHAAAVILDKQTYYLDVEDTYRGIKDVDMVPNLSLQNLAAVEIGKDFMVSHGYIKNDFDEA